jgi:hypothetical protein
MCPIHVSRLRCCRRLLTADALLLSLTMAHVLPLWLFRYFPSQDGPAHLENASILRWIVAPDGDLWRAFYVLNPRPEPNYIGHCLLVALLAICSPLVAEKLLLTAYVALFPWSVRFALGAVDQRQRFLSLLAVPFVHGWLLYMGFYNFCLSLPLLFLMLGAWFRLPARCAWRPGLLVASLGILLYFAHVFSLAAAVLILSLDALWRLATGTSSERKDAGVRWGTALAALVPSFVLTARFLEGRAGWPGGREAFQDLWIAFRELHVLVALGEHERLVASAYFWGLMALVVAVLVGRWRGRALQASDGMLVGAVLFTALYFVAPRGLAGGAVLHPRLSLLPVFCLWLWLAAQPFQRRARLVVVSTAVILSLAALALRYPVHSALAHQLDEYLSVGHATDPQTLLLPLCYARSGVDAQGRSLTQRVEPFVHAASYLAVERRLLELANYEANKGHFPLLFRPEVNPYRRMGPYAGIEGAPPCIDVLAYSQRTRRPVTYVLTWDLEGYEQRATPVWRARPRPHREERACVQSVKAQLAEAYELVDVSEGEGRARLYRLRPAARDTTDSRDRPPFVLRCGATRCANMR